MFLNAGAMLLTSYTIIGIMAGLLTIIGFIKRPWTEKAKVRRQQKKVLKLFMNGDPGVKGLIDAIVPGPERVQATETMIKDHTELLRKQEEIQRQQGVLLETVASGLSNLTNIVIKLDKKMTSNGGTTNDPGDVQMRMAKSSGVWLTEEELKTATKKYKDQQKQCESKEPPSSK